MRCPRNCCIERILSLAESALTRHMKTRHFNSFRIRTYEQSRSNPPIIRTYKNKGVGGSKTPAPLGVEASGLARMVGLQLGPFSTFNFLPSTLSRPLRAVCVSVRSVLKVVSPLTGSVSVPLWHLSVSASSLFGDSLRLRVLCDSVNSVMRSLFLLRFRVLALNLVTR